LNSCSLGGSGTYMQLVRKKKNKDCRQKMDSSQYLHYVEQFKRIIAVVIEQEIRRRYFNNEGAVPWQYDRLN